MNAILFNTQLPVAATVFFWIIHKQLIIILLFFIQPILVSQKLITKAVEYSFLSTWLGECMFLTTGEKVEWLYYHPTYQFSTAFMFLWITIPCRWLLGSRWKNRRRLLTPAFHFQILNSFVDVFNEKSFECGREFERAIKHHDGGEFDVFPIITQCALDIICGTLVYSHFILANGKDSL